MTTEFNFSRVPFQLKKNRLENLKLSLFSPLTLMLLLAVLFTFFLTASGGNSYTTSNEREIIKTQPSQDEKKKATALRYERIVTSADPIRSILQ